MNYIKQLQEENERLKNQLKEINEVSMEYLRYFSLPKFEGTENDYCHVKTDVYIKINNIKNLSL
jgi:hypothetical protein